MKKSTLAISVVAALAAITTGGAWFTGSQVEQRYTELLDKANQSLQLLSAYGIQNAKVSDVQFNKGVFSSDVKYIISGEMDGKLYRFSGDDKVFHGPLPLNRLAKANLSPALLSVESHLSPDTEELKALFSQKEAMRGTTTISYSGKGYGENTIFAMKNADGSLETSDIHISGDYLNSPYLGSHQLSAEKIKFSAEQTVVEFNGISYTADFDSEKPANYPNLEGIGPYQFSMKSLSMSGNEPNALRFTLDNVSIKGDSKLSKDRLAGDMSIISGIQVHQNDKNINFGTFRNQVDVDFSATSVDQFMQIQRKQMQGEHISDEAAQNALLALTTSAPVLKMNELSIENSKGKYGLTLDIALNPFNPQDLAHQTNISAFLKLFKPSKITLNTSVAALEESMKQTAMLEMPEENAQAQAKAKVAELVAQAKAIGMVSEDGQTVQGLVEIRDDHKMYFNGKALTEQELQMAAMVIIFGMGRF